MTSNKCPKCGFLTFARAEICKNCSYQFTSNPTDNQKNFQQPNSEEQTEEPQSWVDVFCGFNLILVAIVCGVVFCIYWDMYVLSNILPSGRYPMILLILLYLPVGILAIGLGIIWSAILQSFLKMLGLNSSAQ